MNTGKAENLKKIMRFLTGGIADALSLLSKEETEKLCEIRLRAGLPAVLIFTDSRKFITTGGRMTAFISSGLLSVTPSEIETVFNRLCEYSVHSLSQSISDGYITADGGNRIGIYGTAVTENGRVVSVRNIRGMNIRISGQFFGSAKPVSERLYRDSPVNTLICGPPSSGKTTMLKDLCRILSDEYMLKVAVIDERSEMGDSSLGFNTDILTRYPKSAGIETAVRTLSPEIIVCDEIGSMQEVAAINGGLNSGVNFVMTMHCRSFGELKNKPQFKALQDSGAIDYCVLLGDGKCKIESIISAKEIIYENSGVDGAGNNVLPCRTVHSLHSEYESKTS